MASSSLEQLLLVQEHDTHLDQLRHRRATHPARGVLAELQARLDALVGELTDAREAAGAVANRQAAIEAELGASEARAAELEKRLYSGTVSASRDLMAMTDELDSLKHRRSTLEDRVLEAMTEREPLDARVSDLERQYDEVTAEQVRVQAELAEAEAEIDAEIAAEEAVRAELASSLPDGLHTQYDKLRAHLGGTGAARLVGGSCGGCHLALPASELDRIKKADADAVLTCEQCGRILVP